MESDNAHDRVRLQEFNQALARAGGRAILPDAWAASSSMAEAIGELDAVEFKFDSNAIAQRMAAELIRNRAGLWARREERPVDTRYCAEYDDSKVETMSRLYVLTHMDTEVFPLSSPAQYEQVAAELIGDIGGCAPGITTRCDNNPRKFVAVRRGEYLCLFKICQPCREALETLTVDSPEYCGPKEWVDDRTWDPETDPFLKKSPWSDQYSEWEPPKPPPSDDDPWSI